jgi:hypothetical protein
MRIATVAIPTGDELIADGCRHYSAGKAELRLAAQCFAAALEVDRTLTQKTLAQRAGISETAICRLLGWYRAGCPSDTVYGPEIALRRAAKKEPVDLDGGYKQTCFEFYPSEESPRPRDEHREAFIEVAAVKKACANLARAADGVTRDKVLLAYPDSKHQDKFYRDVGMAIKFATGVMNEKPQRR